MKILNTVIFTRPAPFYGKGCRSEETRRYIRPYKLTFRGARRMIKMGDGDHDPLPDADVCRIEYAIFASS